MHAVCPRRSARLAHRLSTLLSGCCARWSGSLVALLLALVPTAAAHAQVFSNNAEIIIPSSGTASLYPSTIEVAGFVGTPNGLRVRLKNFSHTFPGDVSALLVAPSGQGIQLLSRNGFGADASNLTLTFGAESTTPLPAPLVSGNFQPARGTDFFAPPANGIPRAASLGALIAGSPNGQWRLFVQDFVTGDGGSISAGWELEFGDFGDFERATTPSSPSTFTYQGRLDGGEATGSINARFSLWSHPSTGAVGNRLAAPVTVNGIAVTNGLFTTPVNLGVPVPTDVQTWLQVEISSPAGGPFVTLTPRQPITATPLAGVAQRAALADLATNATNAINATNAVNATNAANVASGGFAVGALIGPGTVTGFNQHDVLNRGVKSRVGYSVVPTGLTEFAGMITSLVPGTTGGGNSADLTFHTWEFGTSISREIMRINGRGNVGIGTASPTARLDITSGSLGSSSWQMVINNTSVPQLRGGMRLTDLGFLELTNNAAVFTPNFARLDSTGAWTAVSDARLKTDISNAHGNLAAALELRPVTFRWKSDGTEDLGLIAQEARDVLPTLVRGDEATDTLTLNYSQLSVVAIGAIQELKAQHDREIERLHAENAELKARLEAIEAAVLNMKGQRE
jgi:subtilisin-like proprotein convertase family protein